MGEFFSTRAGLALGVVASKHGFGGIVEYFFYPRGEAKPPAFTLIQDIHGCLVVL